MRISNGEENCNSVSRHGPNYEYYTFGMDNDDVIDTTVTSSRSYYHHNADVRRAVDGIVYIAEQMQREDDVRNVSGGHSALTSVTSVSTVVVVVVAGAGGLEVHGSRHRPPLPRPLHSRLRLRLVHDHPQGSVLLRLNSATPTAKRKTSLHRHAGLKLMHILTVCAGFVHVLHLNYKYLTKNTVVHCTHFFLKHERLLGKHVRGSEQNYSSITKNIAP